MLQILNKKYSNYRTNLFSFSHFTLSFIDTKYTTHEYHASEYHLTEALVSQIFILPVEDSCIFNS